MATDYNKIFRVPERCLLQKRLTKAFFLKNFELSSAEKKVLSSIDSMEWMASIKPTTSNINPVVNDEYAFEEVQIIICSFGVNEATNLFPKAASLIQKYIPYHLILVVEDPNNYVVNICEKRINQNDRSKRTISKEITSPLLNKLFAREADQAFLRALSYIELDKANMQRLYKAYLNAVIQFKAAKLTGSFVDSPERKPDEDLKRLLEIEALEQEIAALRNQIKKEKQLNRKVPLNIEIQTKKKEIEDLKTQLASNA